MKKKIAISLILVLVLSLFAGCKSEPKMNLTKEEVLSGVSENMRSLKSVTFAAKLDMQIAMSYMGEADSAVVQIDANGEYSGDPQALHFTADLNADGDKQYGEAYLFFREGETVSYTRSSPDGAFEQSVKKAKQSSSTKSVAPLSDLDWQMETADDRYILTHTLTEEDSKALMAALGGVEDLNELLSMDGLVNSDSGLAGVALTMEVSPELQLLGMSADFTPLVSQAFQLMPGIDTTGTRAVLSLTMDNHNSAIVIEPPEFID